VKPELAVLGGSFDPPHIGHVFLATYARSVAGVARVLVAPTFEHAFGKPLSAFEHRLRMSELAFSLIDGVEVSPIERELGGVSRTLRLVQELARRFPDHQLRLLVGADILLETQRWLRFEDIVALAPLLVAERAGFASAGDSALAHAGTAPPLGPGAGPPVLPQVSSSEIRRALSELSSLARTEAAPLDQTSAPSALSSWLPRQVHAYIVQHGLYAPSEP
jgi:nicotinate-nucleotide adenylyltransferase